VLPGVLRTAGLSSSERGDSIRAHYPAWDELRFRTAKQLTPERLPYRLRLRDVFSGRSTRSGVGDRFRVTIFHAQHSLSNGSQVMVVQQSVYQLSHTSF
jgi:hypothetical protein